MYSTASFTYTPVGLLVMAAHQTPPLSPPFHPLPQLDTGGAHDALFMQQTESDLNTCMQGVSMYSCALEYPSLPPSLPLSVSLFVHTELAMQNE